MSLHERVDYGHDGDVLLLYCRSVEYSTRSGILVDDVLRRARVC